MKLLQAHVPHALHQRSAMRAVDGYQGGGNIEIGAKGDERVDVGDSKGIGGGRGAVVGP